MPEQVATLNEIEATMRETLNVGDTSFLAQEDGLLLIRAVGQLGELYGTTYTMAEQADMIDPDVLALLEDDDAQA